MTYDELMESILTAQEEMLKCQIEANSVTLNGRRYGKLIENLPPNTKPTVFGMAVKADYALPEDYDFLVQYEPPQPQTNANRIRAMTDDELTRFFAENCGCGDWCMHHRSGACANKPENECCLDVWHKWLKAEVSG